MSHLVATAGSALAPGNAPAASLGSMIARCCAVLALAICVWLLVGTAAWRRAVLAACGIAVVALPLAAAAEGGGTGDPAGHLGATLDGLPMPERPSGRAVVVVREGDSLWGIAAASLPAAAGPRQIAGTWPRWYMSNSARIGPDPDLIYPGTVLRPPTDRTRG